MKIAVLSDTHLFSPNDQLVAAFENHLHRADLVIHCGDITAEAVWAYLNSLDNFWAVAGNMDQGPWAQDLPRKLELEYAGLRIGVIHGDLLGARLFGVDLLHHFSAGTGLVCYGHTHRRDWRVHGDCYVLNPGSFSLPKGSGPGFAEVCYVHGEEPQVRWVEVG